MIVVNVNVIATAAQQSDVSKQEKDGCCRQMLLCQPPVHLMDIFVNLL